MQINLKPLYSQLNPGVGHCPLNCQERCRVQERAPTLKPPPGYTCPLSSHQAETYQAVVGGDADIIFNKSATGDGKTLSGSLPSLLDEGFRLMALYPTIELVEDQTQQQRRYHELFGLDADSRIDRLFGEELNRRVQEESSSKFQALLMAIYHKPILLTNPDIFHFITHYRYRKSAVDPSLLPLALAEWPDLWMFDEFHIFGPHQEAAALNSLTLIRRTQQGKRPRRFLFTSATPKPDFIAQLQQADFEVREISGRYTSDVTPGYRQILQAIALEFVELGDGDAVQWLVESADLLRRALPPGGRGLIILNSIAAVNRVVSKLSDCLPGVRVREISGRIDRKRRSQIQGELKDSPDPVLIVATSAVDVGVDFRIHLLICEGSDAATVVQRLGRLGRHPGFAEYRAFVLVSRRTPWVMARLQEAIASEEPLDRTQFHEAIAEAFEPPKAFEEYRQHWGPLQAQGMMVTMSQENSRVSQPIRDCMTEDLNRVYPNRLESARRQWFGMMGNPVGKATQGELLRFRGGTALQAAVWDGLRFYTYDLLRLLPYALVELCDRQTFLTAATAAGYGIESFPEAYIQVYLRVQEWVEDRIFLSLSTSRDTSELHPCELSLLDRLMTVGHPQEEVKRCLQRRKFLAFLVPVNRTQTSSHWQVGYQLKLPPTFGLYRLTDTGGQAYACAFNQDALLLEASKWKLQRFCRSQPKSLIF